MKSITGIGKKARFPLAVPFLVEKYKMTNRNIEIAEKFISDLRKSEHDGRMVHIPEHIIDWKELDDGSYIVIFEDDPYAKLKEAWGELLDAIAKDFHLYDILEWLDAKISK